jgi:hypothetical protein
MSLMTMTSKLTVIAYTIIDDCALLRLLMPVMSMIYVFDVHDVVKLTEI